MNVLDENILESQRQLLRGWRVPVRQIGHELGRKGMQDGEILPYLLTLKQPTLFTRDLGFYDRSLLHPAYCLAVLAVGQYEAAHFVRRFLLHREFNTHSKRMGAVIRVMHTGSVAWRKNERREILSPWLAE